MNRMAKATEIRFITPMTTAAKLMVSARPSTSVARIGTISRQERSARYSHSAISSDADDAAHHQPLGERGELLVRERDLPGIVHRGAPGFHIRQGGGDAHQRRGRDAARLQRALVEHGMGEHELGMLLAETVGDQRLPGERHRMAVRRRLQVRAHALPAPRYRA